MPSINEHLHPLVVHFPVALLLTAPLFIVMALFARRAARSFALAALILLALGTLGAWAAMTTGEAAEDASMITARAEPILERHEELAEVTAIAFSVLTGLLAAIVLVPVLVERLNRPAVVRGALLAFLLLLLGGAALLVRTAHEGGRLVHEFGTSVAIERRS
jgi:uncharacterized membrane protein